MFERLFVLDDLEGQYPTATSLGCLRNDQRYLQTFPVLECNAFAHADSTVVYYQQYLGTTYWQGSGTPEMCDRGCHS